MGPKAFKVLWRHIIHVEIDERVHGHYIAVLGPTVGDDIEDEARKRLLQLAICGRPLLFGTNRSDNLRYAPLWGT